MPEQDVENIAIEARQPEEERKKGEVTVSQEEVDKLELRSEEVQEILSHVPNWIIRWGITAIFFVVLVIIIASYFIKYPDTITSRVVLTTTTPPAHLIARMPGRIDLLVDNEEEVQKGHFLGVISNSADTEDMFYLIEKMTGYKENLYQEHIDLNKLSIRSNLSLGESQAVYLQLLKAIRDMDLQNNLAYHQKQIASLENRIRQYEELNDQLQRQNAILAQELTIQRDRYQTDSSLFDSNAIAKVEFDQSKSTFLQTKRAYENAKSNIINNQIQISQLENQINELRIQQLESSDNLRGAIEDALKAMESEIGRWKQQYLIISPIDGEVTMNTFWSDNQYVNAGDEVMTIIPESQDVIGTVEMPVAGSGKVKVGQQVNMKFDNYPSDEYGMVIGQVESISQVPTKDNIYTIRISLPEGLKSSYNKDLDFKQQMQGNAEIVTKDLRLIERIFNQLRSIFDNMS